MTNLETLKQQTADLEAKLEETTEKLKSMKAEIERMENGWEMKCPYKNGEHYFLVNHGGGIMESIWNYDVVDENRFGAGNVFPTLEAAELESKRRNLLTRFRAFRDECNGDWEKDWKNHRNRKYFISFEATGKLILFNSGTINQFCLFGYFKNEQDAQHAIELFGDEIKELFVEGE